MTQSFPIFHRSLTVLAWATWFVLGLARPSFADMSFLPVTTWTAADWTATGDADSITDGNTLLTTFNAVGFPTIESGLLYTTSAGWIGAYNAIAPAWLSVSFDFQGYASSAEALYFESTGGSSWAYSLASSSHNWEPENISFASSAGWTRLTGLEDFSAALSTVSLIGVTVEHLNTGTALEYGIDNWQFTSNSAGIPEPGTWATICAALIPAAFIVRRELRRRQPGLEPG